MLIRTVGDVLNANVRRDEIPTLYLNRRYPSLPRLFLLTAEEARTVALSRSQIVTMKA